MIHRVLTLFLRKFSVNARNDEKIRKFEYLHNFLA